MPPLRFDPWLTYRAVELKLRSIGTRPVEVPLVPLMSEPLALTSCAEMPIPPANLLMSAHQASAL